MKRNAKLEERRKKIPQDVKIYVEQAFKIADQIDFILKKQGKTQRDLAKALGKSESEISKWLTGEHNFTMRSLAKIQAVLNEPVLLFPMEVSEKIEKQMQVFVFSGTPSLITTALVGKKSVSQDSEQTLGLFSPATEIETLELDTIPFMN